MARVLCEDDQDGHRSWVRADQLGDVSSFASPVDIEDEREAITLALDITDGRTRTLTVESRLRR